jgi:hypothetical protein
MAYSKEQKIKIFNSIISEIENGASLRSAIKKLKTINRDTFNEWVKQDEELSDQYARAMDERIDIKFESIERDYMEEPQRDPITGKIDPGWVQLQRLKIDAKKWELSKLKPKKYSDRIQTEHSGEITTNVISLGSGIKPNEIIN